MILSYSPGTRKVATALNTVLFFKFHSVRPYSDVSPANIDSGFGLGAFKSFASNVSQDAAETTKDPTLNAENHMLRDSLEKERYRRKVWAETVVSSHKY